MPSWVPRCEGSDRSMVTRMISWRTTQLATWASDVGLPPTHDPPRPSLLLSLLASSLQRALSACACSGGNVVLAWPPWVWVWLVWSDVDHVAASDPGGGVEPRRRRHPRLFTLQAHRGRRRRPPRAQRRIRRQRSPQVSLVVGSSVRVCRGWTVRRQGHVVRRQADELAPPSAPDRAIPWSDSSCTGVVFDQLLRRGRSRCGQRGRRPIEGERTTVPRGDVGCCSPH